MKKSKWFKILIGILCVLLLAGVVTAALYLDSLLPDPIFGVFRPLPDNEEDPLPMPPGDEPLYPPEDLPPSVDLPVDEQGEISFPCTVPGYNLVIERMAPYSGTYVENGSNVTLQNVAMLLVTNQGDFPIEYAQISVQVGGESLLFDISALPVGERLVVQEKQGKSIPNGVATAANALVVRRANMEMSRDKIQVVDNGDNSLTITNLTGETIPTVRVFYKYFMKDENVFVGGIAFTVRLAQLEGGASVTVRPSHYSSGMGRVVMALTYDTEV